MAYPAKEVARYLANMGIEQGSPITQLKLQKVLYVAHGLSLAFKDKPLTKENFQAWKYGPVIPDVYKIFKLYGNAPIIDLYSVSENIKNPKLDKDSEEILKKAWEITEPIDGIKLSNWSHRDDSPWKRAFELGLNHAIPNDSLKTYFHDLFSSK